MPDMPQHTQAVCGAGAVWSQLLRPLPQPPPWQQPAGRAAAVMPIQVRCAGSLLCSRCLELSLSQHNRHKTHAVGPPLTMILCYCHGLQVPSARPHHHQLCCARFDRPVEQQHKVAVRSSYSARWQHGHSSSSSSSRQQFGSSATQHKSRGAYAQCVWSGAWQLQQPYWSCDHALSSSNPRSTAARPIAGAACRLTATHRDSRSSSASK